MANFRADNLCGVGFVSANDGTVWSNYVTSTTGSTSLSTQRRSSATKGSKLSVSVVIVIRPFGYLGHIFS